MAESMDVKTISTVIGDPGADNKQLFIAKAPTDAQGGGITILKAYATNGATTSGGTTFTLQLLTYSTAGTPALNGTITSVLGGTAAAGDYWTANLPKAFTVSDGFVDAEEWIVCDYQEENTGNPTNCVLTIQYVMGKA